MIDIYTPDEGKCFYANINTTPEEGECPYVVKDVIEAPIGLYNFETNHCVLISTYDTSLIGNKKLDIENSTFENPVFLDVEFRWKAALSTDEINVGEGDECLSDVIKKVCGSYVGNGMTTRTIELGFTPSAVLVMREDGVTKDDTAIVGGLAVTNSPVTSSDDLYAVAIVENGFMVARNAGVNTNMSVTTYNYVAFK